MASPKLQSDGPRSPELGPGGSIHVLWCGHSHEPSGLAVAAPRPSLGIKALFQRKTTSSF